MRRRRGERLEKGQLVEVDGLKGIVLQADEETARIKTGNTVQTLFKDWLGRWNRKVKVIR